MHRWILIDNFWFIYCEEFKREINIGWFMNKHGICPYCNQNIQKEFEIEKRLKIQQLKEKRESEQRARLGTLGGY